VLSQGLQAAFEQARRLSRHDPVQLADHRRDRVGSGEQAENADRNHQRRRDRQKSVVGEGGGDVGHVILVELFDGAAQDRQVVAFREVARSGVGEPGLCVLGLRLRRLVGKGALCVVLV
jgi:hypothetical protein